MTANLRPWGRVTAILTACVVTLVGVCRQIEPDVILARAAISSCLLGISVSLSLRLLSRSTR